MVESATILGQDAGTTKIHLVQWVGANKGGTKSYSKNILRGAPGQSLAVGLAGWTNTEALNTGEGFVEVSKLQQDAKILMGFLGANQNPSPLVHGATLGIDGITSRIFRTFDGGLQ